jgi:uncharacterized membrane protein HdeD (DUF308 family)
MYILLLILGVLLIVAGLMSLLRTPHTTSQMVWGIVLVILGLIALPSGLSLR